MRDFTGGIMGMSGLSGTQGGNIQQRPLSAGAPQAPAPAQGGGIGNTVNTAARIARNGRDLVKSGREAYQGVGDLYSRIANNGQGNASSGLAAQSGKGLSLPTGESPMPEANQSGITGLVFHPPGAPDPMGVGKLGDAGKAPNHVGSGIQAGGGGAGAGVDSPDNPGGSYIDEGSGSSSGGFDDSSFLYAIGGRVPQYPAPARGGGSPPIGPAIQAGKYAYSALNSGGGAAKSALGATKAAADTAGTTAGAETGAAAGAAEGSAAPLAAAGTGVEAGAAAGASAGAGAAVTSAGAAAGAEAAAGGGATAAAELAPLAACLLADGGEVPDEEGLEGFGSGPTLGLVPGDTPGRADAVNTTALKGSYVVPADVVSALGQGNTLAGAKLLESHAPANTKGYRGGGVMGEAPAVPVKFSGGEFVFSPEQVAAFGGGDVRRGAALLDQLVHTVREETAEQLQNMPPPK